MSFKALSALVVAAIGLSGFIGCDARTQQGSSGSQKSVKIDFWHYFSEEQAKPLKELIAQFEKENPDIKINSVFQNRANDLSQKLNSAFATTPSNNPVMATLYENWTSDFVEKGYMEAVEDHFDGPSGLTKAEQDDIVKVFRENNSWNGKMITMPFNKSIYVLYYNADKLKQAGFTTAPLNLDEFKQAISKTTTGEGGRKSFGLGVAPLSEAFTTLLYANGGEYFDQNGNAIFDSPAGLAALTFLREMQFPERKLYVSTDYMNVPFGNQNIAMYIYSSASFPYNAKAVGDKFQWGVAPIPGNSGDNARYVMQGTNIGIFKNKSDTEKAAAWKFLKFLTNTKSSVYWETRTGYMPIRYSVLEDAEMKQYIEKNPRYKVAMELVLADKGKQEPKIAVWEGIRDDLNGMVDRVLSGADPKSELVSVQAKANQRAKERAARTARLEPAAGSKLKKSAGTTPKETPGAVSTEVTMPASTKTTSAATTEATTSSTTKPTAPTSTVSTETTSSTP